MVVTLPKNWTKMNKLQGGDEVSIKIQGDGSLVIHPELDFKEKQNEAIIPITTQDDVKMIQRKIIGCYLNGFDKIELTSGTTFTPEQQAGIRSIVKSLYMRIYESHANHIILQAFMDESLASVTSGIERMHIITSSMAKDVIKSLQNWDLGLAKSVISLEEDVDQFMFFLTRLLRTAVNNPSIANKLQISMSDCFDYHLLINRIEYIADHLTTIAETFVELYPYQSQVSEPGMEVLIQAASKSFDYYEKAVEAFFDVSLLNTGEIIDYADQKTLIDNGLHDLPHINEAERQIVLLCHSIIEELTTIRNITADIAEITIDRYFTPKS